MERVLREGARRPVLPQLRARSLRPGVRAGGAGLPDRLRALDRAPQPGVLPRSPRPRQRRRGAAGLPRRRLRRRRRDVPAPEGRRPEGRGRAVPLPRAHGGGGGPGSGRARGERAAESGPGRQDAGAARVRRGGQLREFDAAAAPGTARRREVVDRRHHDRAVRGQRAAEVRLRRGDHRPRRRARRQVRRRGVRGHPAQLARGAHPQGAPRRQGRVRGEAPRPHRGRTGRRPGCRGGVRQRPASGRIQPPVLAPAARGQTAVRHPDRPGEPALPGQRGTPRPRELVLATGLRGLAVRG